MVDFGVVGAGLDDARPDAGWADLDGEGLAEGFEGGFGGRVDAAEREFDDSVGRGNHDDPPAVVGANVGQDCLGQAEGPEEVGVECAPEGDAGVVDQDVDGASPADDMLDSCGDGIGVGDVHGKDVDVEMFGGRGVGEPVGRDGGADGGEYVVAGSGELKGGEQTEAAAAPGDHDDGHLVSPPSAVVMIGSWRCLGRRTSCSWRRSSGGAADWATTQ